MDRDLFLSVLAMDSYNRGYGQGVLLSPNDSLTGRNETGRRVGQAVVANFDLPEGSVAAGFCAIAYDASAVTGFAAGERVIAYRGTDKVAGLDGDLLNGWVLGGGWPARRKGA